MKYPLKKSVTLLQYFYSAKIFVKLDETFAFNLINPFGESFRLKAKNNE